VYARCAHLFNTNGKLKMLGPKIIKIEPADAELVKGNPV
jgi:hypothetical protein